MVTSTRKIRPVVLPLSDWSALDEIAGELKCMPLGGRTPDKPSVVTMLRLIARGELVVTRKVTVAQ